MPEFQGAIFDVDGVLADSPYGFAQGGHLHGLLLAACAVGLAATLFSGRDAAAGAGP